MTSTRSRNASLLVAALALGSLAGCSGDGGDDRDRTSSAPTASPESPESPVADATTPSPPPATLEADRPGIATCVTRVSELVVVYDPTARARGDLTLTGAHVTGVDAHLVAAEGVIVTSGKRPGPGGFLGSTWPVEDERLQKKTDVSTRQRLHGMELTDGQRVLPLLRVRVGKHSALESLELSYTDSAGNEGSATLPLAVRFRAAECESLS